ncbi:MAG: DUF2752 domain-containing protein [Bacteroidota bacterium]
MIHKARFKDFPAFLRIFRSYLIANPIGSMAALYAVVGLFLKLHFQVNILPRCPWKTLFDIRCPGCGMTRAFIHILHLDFAGAFHDNPLSFIVFPAITYYVAKDFLKHVKRTALLSPAQHPH